MCGRFAFFIDKEGWTKFTQEKLEMYSVSKKVSNPVNDTPDVLLPADS